ncbi:MAG: hypothetical protein AB8B69_16110 [Chitinophagales bacterium]
MKQQEMNLNIWYHLPEEIWNKVSLIYEEMEGWLGFGEGDGKGEKGIPYWFSFDENEKHICASIEPSGLCFSGQMEVEEWIDWVKEIKKVASRILGFKVGEIELGEVGYEMEYLS